VLGPFRGKGAGVALLDTPSASGASAPRVVAPRVASQAAGTAEVKHQDRHDPRAKWPNGPRERIRRARHCKGESKRLRSEGALGARCRCRHGTDHEGQDRGVIGDLPASDRTPPAPGWALGHDGPVASIDPTLQWGVTVYPSRPDGEIARKRRRPRANLRGQPGTPIRIDKENDHDYSDIS
jgi:hypothetical protein